MQILLAGYQFPPNVTRSLSICIPTYRRPEMLRRCVESAIESAEDEPISIFIADDSLSDINLEVLQDLQMRFPQVHWKRNAVNLGIDRNIQEVISMSSCDYAWLIGEDDVFLPSGVAEMIRRIQHSDEPFIFSNYQCVNEDYTRIVSVPFKHPYDVILTVEEFISCHLWSVGFIGSTVIRCDLWNTTSSEPYDGTYFTHVGRIVDLLGRYGRFSVSSFEAMMNRSQGSDTFTWKKDAYGVFFGFERMCRIAATRHPHLTSALIAAIKTYRSKAGYLSIKTAFRLRSEGALDLWQYRTYISGSKTKNFRKMFLFMLAVTPRIIIIPFAKIYLFCAAISIK